MSEEALIHPTDAIVPVEARELGTSDGRLDELSKILLDFKLTSDQRLDNLEQKLRRSQLQIGF